MPVATTAGYLSLLAPRIRPAQLNHTGYRYHGGDRAILAARRRRMLSSSRLQRVGFGLLETAFARFAILHQSYRVIRGPRARPRSYTATDAQVHGCARAPISKLRN